MFKRFINITAIFLVFIVAIIIFYVSSIPSPSGTAGPPDYFSYVYHFFAFFWLAMFLCFAIVQEEPDRKYLIFFVIFIAVFYAITDEYHQMFVLGRSGNIPDLLTDLSGILTASLIYILSLKSYERRFV